MDAIEFAKGKRRMCQSYYGCVGCSLVALGECSLGAEGTTDEMNKIIIETVEKWAKEHPAKTRQSEFLKLFPNARMLRDGRCLDICPQNLENDINCPEHGDCAECACQYWLKEIE